jgi:light-harvesting complex 1 beta chain
VASPAAPVPAARELRGNSRKAAITEDIEMAGTDLRDGSLTGLTENEAKEFHGIFVTSFIIFTVIAIVAHFLVWQWRPWFPGVRGYAQSMIDSATSVATYLT